MKEITLLTNEVQLSPKKVFNMLISNEMFDQLEAIVGTKHIRLLIAEIVQLCLPALDKVLKSVDRWLLFQHLVTRIVEPNVETKKEEKIEESEENCVLKKQRYHQILIFIQREQYESLKQHHIRLNTFSIAMIIRLMVEVFLVLYKKYGDKNKVFAKLKEEIKNMLKNKSKYKITFACYFEADYELKEFRYFVFLEITYGSENGFEYWMKLIL